MVKKNKIKLAIRVKRERLHSEGKARTVQSSLPLNLGQGRTLGGGILG